MTLKNKMGWREWLVSPIAIVLYALLLPRAYGAASNIAFDIAVWAGEMFANNTQWVWWFNEFLTIALELLGVLLLANMAMGKQLHSQPVGELMRRIWLWVLAAALLHSGIGQLLSWMSSWLERSLPWVPWGLALLEIAALLLLTRLLRESDPATPGLFWRKESLAVLVAAVALPLLYSVADQAVMEQQSAHWGQQSAALSPLLDISPAMIFGLGGDIGLLFSGLNTLLLVGLCFTLAGGRLFPMADLAMLGEPLPMSPQAEQGQRVLGRLLKIWAGLLVAQSLLSFFVGEGLGLDVLCLNLCLAVFLYYGRRWARRIWLALAVIEGLVLVALLVLLLGIMLKGGTSWVGTVVLLGLLLGAPILVVNLMIVLGLLRKNDPVHHYIAHCAVCPPTPQQQKRERRAKVVFWVTVIASIAVLGGFWWLKRNLYWLVF